MTQSQIPVPVDQAPDWLQHILDEDGYALPEELEAAKRGGNIHFRAYKPTGHPPFMVCYDQETGEPTEIYWL